MKIANMKIIIVILLTTKNNNYNCTVVPFFNFAIIFVTVMQKICKTIMTHTEHTEPKQKSKLAKHENAEKNPFALPYN